MRLLQKGGITQMPYSRKMTDEEYAAACGSFTARIIYPFTVIISIVFTIACIVGVDYSLKSILCGYINFLAMTWSAWRKPNGKSLF